MTRVLPKLRRHGEVVDAPLSAVALIGCLHRHRFARTIGRARPLPAGFRKGLTRR